MRGAVVSLGLFGLVLGGINAALYHYLPLPTVGWFAYTPLTKQLAEPSFHPDWLPTIVILPTVGLVLGLAGAVILRCAGWRVVRGR